MRGGGVPYHLYGRFISDQRGRTMLRIVVVRLVYTSRDRPAYVHWYPTSAVDRIQGLGSERLTDPFAKCL